MEALESRLGGFGRYQGWVYGLLFVPCFLSGAITLVFSFTGAVPLNRCCVPGLEDCASANFSDAAAAAHAAAPPHAHGASLCRYCPVLTNNGSCVFEDSKPCDNGHVFDTSVFATSLAITYSMVCERSWMLELAKSMYMLGVLVGAGVFGLLSDKYGRRRVFIGSGLLQILTLNIVPFVAVNYYAFLVLQLFNGAVQYGTFLASFIIIMELINGFARTVCGIWVQGYFAFGYIYVGLVAYLVKDWRWIQWSVSIPTILFIPIAYYLPESIRWSAVNGRDVEARRNLNRIIRMNHLLIPPGIIDRALEVPSKRAEGSVLDLLRHKEMARNTLIVFFTWFVCSMTYYGLSLNTSDLPGNVYVTFLLSGIVELPGYVLCIPMMEYWGRKPTLVLLFAVGGLCCIASGLLPASASAAVVTAAVIGKMCVAAAFAVTYNYSAEIFPTVVRNAGTGFSSLCARIGSILAPQIHLLATVGPTWLPIVVYGGFALAAAALDLLLPETKGRPLPQTIADGLQAAKS